MSEKLIRCRKELSAAISRALERPPCPAVTHLQSAQSSVPRIQERPVESTGPAGPQYSPAGGPYTLESLRLIPAMETIDHRYFRIRKPFSNRENVLHLPVNPSPPVQHTFSEEFQPSLPDLSPPDITRNLLDIIESTSSPVMEEISRTLEWNTDFSRDSDICFSSAEDVLSLDDITPPAGGRAEPVTGEDGMIDMVLDLEDDYSNLKSYFIL